MVDKFTESEISFILDEIHSQKGIPEEIGNEMYNNTIRDLTTQLHNVIMKTEKSITNRKLFILALKEQITKHYYTSKMEPGSMPGEVAGQSIGQPVTQSTLNSFHYSGVASARAMLMGVKKFLEILNATHNPKSSSCILHYPKEKCRTIEDLRNCIGSSLIGITLGQVIMKYEILYDIECAVDIEKRWWYQSYEIINGDVTFYKWCIRFYLDPEKLYKYKLTPQKIVQNLAKYDDISYIYSPLEEGIIDVFIKTSHLQIPIKQKHIINEYTNTFFYINNLVYNKLIDQHVSGIKDIEEIYFVKDQKNDCWYVETTGSNLKDITQMTSETCDTDILLDKLESNNMWEIYHMYGIEATRTFLIKEITNFIGFDGTYIDHHHVELLVDSMTWDGTITSVSRYGIDRSVGPLAKSAFEETMDNLLKAGIYSEKDSLIGVSASIMLGKTSKIGTNTFDLIINPNPSNMDNDDNTVEIKEYISEENKNKLQYASLDELSSNELSSNELSSNELSSNELSSNDNSDDNSEDNSDDNSDEIQEESLEELSSESDDNNSPIDLFKFSLYSNHQNIINKPSLEPFNGDTYNNETIIKNTKKVKQYDDLRDSKIMKYNVVERI
jgi:DNA-directed RNA polymerase beta' subunit